MRFLGPLRSSLLDEFVDAMASKPLPLSLLRIGIFDRTLELKCVEVDRNVFRTEANEWIACWPVLGIGTHFDLIASVACIVEHDDPPSTKSTKGTAQPSRRLRLVEPARHKR